MRKIVFKISPLVLIIAAFAFPAAESQTPENSVARRMRYLASDLFEGRAPGTLGGSLSAKFIAAELYENGLIPIGDEGTFYQYVPMHENRPLKSCELTIFCGDDRKQMKLLNDYVLYKSGERTLIPEPANPVFAGYGISAPEYDYNDYFNLNVQGKVVVLLAGEPRSSDPNFFKGDLPTLHRSPEAKHRTALARGAVGTIIIPNPYEFDHSDWSEIVREFSHEDVTLAYSPSGKFSALFDPFSANVIFEGSGNEVADIYKMHEENRIVSFPLETKMTFYGDFKKKDFLAKNVVGMIEGSDPDLKNEYVVLTAHYDHLGIGYPIRGDSIYNGAMDNAIGVAALLEIAERFAGSTVKTKRSIVFLFTTGEEKGLLGSEFYVDRPLVPLYKTIANVNIDGVSVFDRFKSVVGIGAELSELGDVLETVAEENGLRTTEIPEEFMSLEAFQKSDQYAFARAGIPSIMIYEGLDYENISREEALEKFKEYSDRYHTPFDDLSQNINFEAVDQHVDLIFNFCLKLSNLDRAPKWNPGAIYESERLRTEAENR